ncbi:hypothetical protein PHYBOEH_008274 [Phytophthora boehmeriae]|uniref:Purple acid phosphatase N-terminal domain-containing protein n=1 Tax=Phytophthora boehmeriae TaxID=109152 RepID=A0A8T1W1M7_9STRA|nr:hypothetical protein PHYBOEH_008274 [Phytophthora boehmeriae]
MMGKYTLVSDGEASKDKTAKPSRLTKHMASLLTVALCGFAAAGFLLATTSSRATPSSVLMDAKLRVFKPQPSIEKIQDAVQTQDTNFRLTTWPLLVEDGGDLVVSWEGQAADPLTSKDFVTLSCGPTRGENDYFRKAGVKDWGSTDTSVRFSELYMMRCNYTVVYFHYQAASGLYKAIAKVEAGMRESFDAPKHGHISLSEDETGMTVMFNSASTKTPMVRYGESAEDLSFEATGTSSTYRASDMCHAPATTIGQQSFRDPGYMHTVALTGLKPNTYYFYQYGHGGNNWSKVRRFKSRPAAGTKYANIIAYADMGTFAGPGAASTAGRVYEEVVGNGYDSFLLHFGDISYARSDGSIWDHFFHLIEPYATRVYVLSFELS